MLSDSVTYHLIQLSSKGQPQERAIVVTNSHIFKLDAAKGYQKNRTPLVLSQVGILHAWEGSRKILRATHIWKDYSEHKSCSVKLFYMNYS